MKLSQLQRQSRNPSKNIDGQSGSYDKALKLALIGVTDPIQQREITQQIRNSYSGKEAAQLAEREQQVARQQRTDRQLSI